MGDAFSREEDFDFLESEFAAMTSEKGRRHLWLWLTKRPEAMRKFADRLGGFPANLCAMASVTSRTSLSRIDALRGVDAHIRGLSVEPLYESLGSGVDLTDIDWVIVGGESGHKQFDRPFDLAWARDLRDQCAEQGVAFFVKQLGGNPVDNGRGFDVTKKGEDWDEWPEDLRVREFPQVFHEYASVNA